MKVYCEKHWLYQRKRLSVHPCWSQGLPAIPQPCSHVLLDQPPVQIQLDCGASCYVTPQCCKAATWDWKSGHTLVMHNKAIQKPAGKCGLSRDLDTCMCHLCQSKLWADLRTALWHPQSGRGKSARAIMIALPRCKKSECPEGKMNWEIEHQYNWQNSWRYISTRLHHTAVKAGNWAWVLTTHLDLVWKSLEKLKITKALKINCCLLPAVEDVDGPWIFQVKNADYMGY